MERIVGYQGVGLANDVQILKGLMFVNCTERKMQLQEIKMEEATSDGGTTIRWLNSDGSYSKASWTFMKDKDYLEFGWGDAITFDRIDTTFKPGQGFFITPGQNVGACKIVIAGQLYTCETSGQVALELTPDLQELVANPMPNNGFKLSEIPMVEGMSDGGTTLRWMNPDNSYTKVSWTFMKDKDYLEFGWGDPITFERAEEKLFAPGESFFVTPGQNVGTARICFPNPLAAKTE